MKEIIAPSSPRLLHAPVRAATMPQSLKNQVSGCEPPGVRQCWAMQTREGMLPSLFDADAHAHQSG